MDRGGTMRVPVTVFRWLGVAAGLLVLAGNASQTANAQLRPWNAGSEVFVDLTTINLSPCQGKFNSTTWTNCVGTYVTPKGNKYVGDFKNGKKHGRGIESYANGDQYVGAFKGGKRHGLGKFTSTDGKNKEGVWKNNNFSYTKKNKEFAACR